MKNNQNNSIIFPFFLAFVYTAAICYTPKKDIYVRRKILFSHVFIFMQHTRIYVCIAHNVLRAYMVLYMLILCEGKSHIRALLTQNISWDEFLYNPHIRIFFVCLDFARTRYIFQGIIIRIYLLNPPALFIPKLWVVVVVVVKKPKSHTHTRIIFLQVWFFKIPREIRNRSFIYMFEIA